MAIEVAERHRSLLAALREEMGDAAGPQFAAAAERLAEDFGEVTAPAVEAPYETVRDAGPAGGTVEFLRAPREELPSLYRPGHMRRRLDQVIENNRRYRHPFGLAGFGTSRPRQHAPPARPRDRPNPPLRPSLRARRLRHLRPRHQGGGRQRDGAGGG